MQETLCHFLVVSLVLRILIMMNILVVVLKRIQVMDICSLIINE